VRLRRLCAAASLLLLGAAAEPGERGDSLKGSGGPVRLPEQARAEGAALIGARQAILPLALLGPVERRARPSRVSAVACSACLDGDKSAVVEHEEPGAGRVVSRLGKRSTSKQPPRLWPCEKGSSAASEPRNADAERPANAGVTAGRDRPWLASAYCHCRACTVLGLGITASGTKPIQGWTAACDLPLGTLIRVTIPGLGSRLFQCSDRGSAIKGRRVDLYHESHTEALRFGVREARVEVLHDR
jgi:3D (Asp-Asp-Asp) domain-containing protein